MKIKDLITKSGKKIVRERKRINSELQKMKREIELIEDYKDEVEDG